jgi:hypothetical protein
MKGKEKVEQSVPGGEDAWSNVAKKVIKIGNNDVVMGGCLKGSVIINSSTQAQVGNNSRSSQPRQTIMKLVQANRILSIISQGGARVA